MSQTTTVGSIGLRTYSGRPTRAPSEWLAGAASVLRDFLSLRRATPEEISAREVQAVRAMAYEFRNTDPGFASDLYAAACRHESASEETARSAS